MNDPGAVAAIALLAMAFGCGLAAGLAWAGRRTAQVVDMHVEAEVKNAERFDAERAQWRTERQKLLDRIQAPDLQVYKAYQPDETPTRSRGRTWRSSRNGLVRVPVHAPGDEAEEVES